MGQQDCDVAIAYNNGCRIDMQQPKSYGPAFNAVGGGW